MFGFVFIFQYMHLLSIEKNKARNLEE